MKEALQLWHRIYLQLADALPEARASSGPAPDIEDAFKLLDAAHRLIREGGAA
jgi:hypothetical protein